MHDKLYEYYLGTLSSAETEKFELHLLECQSCQQKIASLDRAFHIMRRDRDYYAKKLNLKTLTDQRVVFPEIVIRYAIAAIIILAVGLTLYSFWQQPDNYSLARLSGEQELIRLKSSGKNDYFENAITFLQEEDYNSAIRSFQHFLATHPNNYQANYFLGLAHLAAGEKSFLWYHHFSDEHSRASIQYLEAAQKLAGDNQFYQEDCLWLLGKAWLRLGEKEKAKNAWQEILNLTSPDLVYKDRIRSLIDQIK